VPFERVADTSLDASVGLTLAVPVGNRALVDAGGQLDLYYYDQLSELRNVFDSSDVGVVAGGKNLLFRFDGSYRSDRVRPTPEFEILANQTVTALAGLTTVRFGGRHQLTLSFDERRIRIQDLLTSEGELPAGNNLDRRETGYRLHLERRLTRRATAVVEGDYESIDFDVRPDDTNAYGAAAGVTFSPRGNVRGDAIAGFKRIQSELGADADFNGLVSRLGLTARLNQRIGWGTEFLRDAFPSLLGNDRFFVANRVAASVFVYFERRFYVNPIIAFGRNTWRRPTSYVDHEEREVRAPLVDRFSELSVVVARELSASMTLKLTAAYWNRDSDARIFSSDLFFVKVSMESTF